MLLCYIYRSIAESSVRSPLRPSVEATGEVRTNINLYTAEEGRTGGAAINVITKSGTNRLHGSAYEFFRNDITDARNFFAPASFLSHKPELRQNQFGGSLAGHILKDKTFFFVDYEGLRRIDGTNSVYVSTVPTPYEDAHPGSVADIARARCSHRGHRSHCRRLLQAVPGTQQA